MDTKQTYSLCPRSEGAEGVLYEQMKKFADQQQARFFDRGTESHGELSRMNSNVLKETGGRTLLLTVEKPEEFRISATNLGLKEKIALAVRVVGNSDENHGVKRFIEDLRRYWTVQEVDGSVTNDPPC
jgi:hypothetical protein